MEQKRVHWEMKEAAVRRDMHAEPDVGKHPSAKTQSEEMAARNASMGGRIGFGEEADAPRPNHAHSPQNPRSYAFRGISFYPELGQLERALDAMERRLNAFENRDPSLGPPIEVLSIAVEATGVEDAERCQLRWRLALSNLRPEPLCFSATISFATEEDFFLGECEARTLRIGAGEGPHRFSGLTFVPSAVAESISTVTARIWEEFV